MQCVRDPATVRGVDLCILPGHLTLLLGAPDSGHELLWRMLGLLELPDAGDVLIEGKSAAALNEAERGALRDQRLGFVFASPFLLPGLSLLENVAMPLFKISSANTEVARQRTDELLSFVGLKDLAQMNCGDLAPFEQFAAALARALVNEPAVVLVENSGLGAEESSAFLALLRRAARQFGVGVVAAAGLEAPVGPDDHVVQLEGGVVVRDEEPLPKSDT